MPMELIAFPLDCDRDCHLDDVLLFNRVLYDEVGSSSWHPASGRQIIAFAGILCRSVFSFGFGISDGKDCCKTSCCLTPIKPDRSTDKNQSY